MYYVRKVHYYVVYVQHKSFYLKKLSLTTGISFERVSQFTAR
jgi:hypothetical protein